MPQEQHKQLSTIVFQCPKTDKAKFCQAAHPGKLTDWILKTLRKQAEKELNQ